MSIGTETVQPNPIDQTIEQTDPNATATAAPGGGAPEIDIDDASLNAALAAAEAEDAGAGTQTEGTTPAAAAAAAPVEGEPGQKPNTPFIPKVRFDQEREGRDRAERDAAYWRGVAEARAHAAAAAPAQQQQPAAPAPNPLEAIANATESLAKRFDDGEITMAEFKREERALVQQEQAIREQQMLSRMPTAPAKAETEDLYMESLTAQIEQQHPWTLVFEEVGSKADWDLLVARAGENLAGRGVDVSKKSAFVTIELRKEVAKMADQLGPALVGDKAKAKGIALPGTQAAQQQAAPAAPGASPNVRARQAALAKAAMAPPDINALGYTGTASGDLTDAQVEAMSEEDWDKLPAGLRNKALGIA